MSADIIQSDHDKSSLTSSSQDLGALVLPIHAITRRGSRKEREREREKKRGKIKKRGKKEEEEKGELYPYIHLTHCSDVTRNCTQRT